MKILALIFTLLVINQPLVQADEICSRSAIINYQEVPVDTGPNNRGEGLRFYLSKDKVAEEYLNKYQDEGDLGWHNAIMGTLGSALVLTSIFRSNDDSDSLTGRNSLFIGGATLIALNFLIGRTVQHGNEKNLMRAVDEYNKRNLPKIYFNPYQDVNERDGSKKLGIGAGIIQDF